MTVSILTASKSLRYVNKEIDRCENPQWYIDVRRIHPERQIRLPIVRCSSNEILAREFFVKAAHDPEILAKREILLSIWSEQR